MAFSFKIIFYRVISLLKEVLLFLTPVGQPRRLNPESHGPELVENPGPIEGSKGCILSSIFAHVSQITVVCWVLREVIQASLLRKWTSRRPTLKDKVRVIIKYRTVMVIQTSKVR